MSSTNADVDGETLTNHRSVSRSETADDNEPRQPSEQDDRKALKEILERRFKHDPWPEQFTKVVNTRTDGVLKTLKEFQVQSIAAKQAFDAEIGPLISAALGGLAVKPSDPASFSFPIQVQYLSGETQPYCTAMVDMLTEAGRLLILYDYLASRESHPTRLEDIATSFEKDKTITMSTVGAGAKVARGDTEALLTDRFHEVRAQHEITAEEEHKGRLLLRRGVDKDAPSKASLGWGNVAVDTIEAMERLCYAGDIQDHRH